MTTDNEKTLNKYIEVLKNKMDEANLRVVQLEVQLLQAKEMIAEQEKAKQEKPEEKVDE